MRIPRMPRKEEGPVCGTAMFQCGQVIYLTIYLYMSGQPPHKKLPLVVQSTVAQIPPDQCPKYIAYSTSGPLIGLIRQMRRDMGESMESIYGTGPCSIKLEESLPCYR